MESEGGEGEQIERGCERVSRVTRDEHERMKKVVND